MAELIADNQVSVAWLAEDQQELLCPAAAVVRWRPSSGRLAQVYINGELAAVGDDPAAAELIVPLIANLDWPACNVQVVAVEPSESAGDFSSLLPLDSQSRGGRVLLRWLRTHDALPGSTVNLFGNGGQGEINFSVPLNDQPIEWYPDGQDLCGFGLSGFGQACFGYDGQVGLGLEPGGFGAGEFGFDDEWASWLSPPLASGPAARTYCFAAIASDPLGNPGSASPVAEAVIVAPPPRISNLAITGHAAGDAIVVTWGVASG